MLPDTSLSCVSLHLYYISLNVTLFFSSVPQYIQLYQHIFQRFLRCFLWVFFFFAIRKKIYIPVAIFSLPYSIWMLIKICPPDNVFESLIVFLRLFLLFHFRRDTLNQSIPSVSFIHFYLKHNKTFGGSLNDAETITQTGILRKTFYKYKKELLLETAS